MQARICFGLPVLAAIVKAADTLAGKAKAKADTKIILEIRGDGHAVEIDIKTPDFDLHGLAMPMREDK